MLSPGRPRADLLGMTVLLAEDDFMQARETQHALQHAGCRVVGPFADSTSALRAVAKRNLSCAVLDVALSDGVRFGIAAALRDKGVPFIFLTANGALIPQELGDTHTLAKPVDFRFLLKGIAEVCRPRGSSKLRGSKLAGSALPFI